ncbi:HAD family hydrolase [Proteiniphilum sp.]|uniref:HAD family hydrolase n=1 Tax=Proteiniphilum sp. TaxID=1926877 RepID=UPI002B1FB1ED|nr:HAD family hydrolase [Proteiniphilum sp.]MEA4916378.1 HAD family hydrolase [Proteiniphilum sp.]
MNCKGIIFDLDGTLVDSIEDIANAMNRVLAENGFPEHSLAAYKIFVGRGLLNLTRRALPETVQDEGTVKACYQRMTEVYNDHCIEKTKPYDGIMPLLDELQSRGFKLAVFSNKADQFTKKIVQVLMPGYFDRVAGMTVEELKKPNPACALQISEDMGVSPGEILYLGDTGIDMETASNAGMYAVGVLWGFRSESELVDAGAKSILHHPLDLIRLLSSPDLQSI